MIQEISLAAASTVPNQLRSRLVAQSIAQEAFVPEDDTQTTTSLTPRPVRRRTTRAAKSTAETVEQPQAQPAGDTSNAPGAVSAAAAPAEAPAPRRRRTRNMN